MQLMIILSVTACPRDSKLEKKKKNPLTRVVKSGQSEVETVTQQLSVYTAFRGDLEGCPYSVATL